MLYVARNVVACLTCVDFSETSQTKKAGRNSREFGNSDVCPANRQVGFSLAIAAESLGTDSRLALAQSLI